MPYNNQNYQNRYYQPFQEEQQEPVASVSEESLHEIREYNDTKDKIKMIQAEIVNATTENDLLFHMGNLYMLLQAADHIWLGIAEVVKHQVDVRKLSSLPFEYKNEFRTFAEKVKTYIEYKKNPAKFYEDPDEEFETYISMSPAAQFNWLKEQMDKIINDALDQWVKFAAKIDFGMPIELKESKNFFFKATQALQIRFTEEDYKEYLNVANTTYKQIAYVFALYKVREGGHIQCAISGEFNHGKSTAALLIALWDSRFTRLIMKRIKPKLYKQMHDQIRFSVEDNVVISERDPASKYIMHPKPLNPLVIDEAYLFATTADATSTKFRRLRDALIQNRKQSPSFYWIYANFFKMPNAFTELMLAWIHKTSKNIGEVVIPSTQIQLPEKFDKMRIQKYAKHPESFRVAIKFHPAFVGEIRTKQLKGKTWERYLEKYQKYQTTTDEIAKKPTNQKISFLTQIDALITKHVINVNSKEDIQKFIKRLLLAEPNIDENSATVLSADLATEYQEWKEEKVSEKLVEKLNTFLINKNKMIGDEAWTQ
ncbi:MAG: hypothetical protein QXP36_14375 [Conexivisphaerales archaeon]